jgi:hypothetical protein
MNTELIEPALNELLQNTRELKAEVKEQRKLLQKLVERSEKSFDIEALKVTLQTEIEKLKIQLEQTRPEERKAWTLFSNDFQAQNFKVVVETVCKWIAIICGSFYLLSSLFSLWK